METDNLHGEDDIKSQELNDARLLVEDATEQLRSEANDLVVFEFPFFEVVFMLLFVNIRVFPIRSF